MMNEEKTEIIQYNDVTSNDSCDSISFIVNYCDYFKLQNNYILEWTGVKHHVGINSVYLTVDRNEWNQFHFENKKELEEYILDDDPFLEYYSRDLDTFLVDTNLYKNIDMYIANDELVSKLGFKQLK